MLSILHDKTGLTLTTVFVVFLATVVSLWNPSKTIVSFHPMETPCKHEILLQLPIQKQALFTILIIGNDF